jgi:hypothetical protein
MEDDIVVPTRGIPHLIFTPTGALVVSALRPVRRDELCVRSWR